MCSENANASDIITARSHLNGNAIFVGLITCAFAFGQARTTQKSTTIGSPCTPKVNIIYIITLDVLWLVSTEEDCPREMVSNDLHIEGR